MPVIVITALRPFPRNQRKLTTQGRSASSFVSTGAQAARAEARSDEGRGFMKMWKGMFPQQESNIIIITQPAPTTTTTTPTTTSPTTTGTTSSTAAAARDGDSDSVGNLALNDDIVNTQLFNVNEPAVPDVSLPTNAYGRKNKVNRRRNAQGNRNRNRNRRRRQNQKPQNRNRNRKRAEQIAQSLAKKPISSGNIFSINGNGVSGGGGGGGGNGGLKTNERIQSIMNALRQQIVYN